MAGHSKWADIQHHKGLGSIDVLEVALKVSRRHGLPSRSDDERQQQIFAESP